MNTRFWISAVALVATGAFTAHAFTKTQAPDEAKMMALVSPGEGHKLLDDKVGKWNLVVKMSPVPGMPAQESAATSEMKWVLGGRFIEDHTKGTFNGEPFEGIGHGGYDNMKQKYVSTWMDNWGTGIMSTEGTYDAATKTFTYEGDMPDPMLGKIVRVRMIEKVTDKDHWTMTMLTPGENGKHTQMMEIQYTRAK